jgi:hypothetical protein
MSRVTAIATMPSSAATLNMPASELRSVKWSARHAKKAKMTAAPKSAPVSGRPISSPRTTGHQRAPRPGAASRSLSGAGGCSTATAAYLNPAATPSATLAEFELSTSAGPVSMSTPGASTKPCWMWSLSQLIGS